MFPRSRIAQIIVGAVVVSAAAPARGDCNPQQLAKLTAPNAQANDFFGNTVAISGNTAVIGAFETAGAGGRPGSAYVFVLVGGEWTLQARLVASDGAADDAFGRVAIWGDTIVVGAYRNDHAGGSNAGAAYVFVKPPAGWADMTETVKLTASDASADDEFGIDVAVFGETIVVGSYLDDHAAGGDAGSVYVFVNMTETAKLTAVDASGGDRFGNNVDVWGNTILIGAMNDDDGGGNSGSAYAFTGSAGAWSQQAKMTAADAAGDDLFGASVALWHDTAIISAYRDDDLGENSGSAYVFTRNGSNWTQTQKLTASDSVAHDSFGASEIGLSGNTAVIGAFQNTHSGASRAGAAYVFARCADGLWSEKAKITASDPANNDFFGTAALWHDRVAIGAPGDDDGGNSSGSAYIFDLDCGGFADTIVEASPVNCGPQPCTPFPASNVLGPPDVRITNFDNDGSIPGYVTVAFCGHRIEDTAGNDVIAWVLEQESFEGFRVLASQDGNTFYEIGQQPGAGCPGFDPCPIGFDLANASPPLDWAAVIKIENLNIDPPQTTCCEGPDLDAVQALCVTSITDCNNNCIPDEIELSGNDCNGNMVPDDCEPDPCDGDGILDPCDDDDDNDGIPDASDVCPCTRACLAVDAQGRPLADVNRDCEVNALDIQPLLDALLCQ